MNGIRPDKMLVATFLSTVFYSVAYPAVHREIMQYLPEYMLALEQIISCLGIVFAGVLWNKYSDTLFRKFPLFCVLETVAGIIITVYAIASNNIVAYYILDTLVFALITRNIICGGNRLRSERCKITCRTQNFHTHDAKKRQTLKRRLIDSIIYELLAEEFNLSVI